VLTFMFIVLSSVSVFSEAIDLTTSWDSVRVLENPHKGWYHHYPDNGTHRYIPDSDGYLDDFPGMDHVFIRLSWSHFEPEEDQYDWTWIDTVVNRWVPKGYDIGIAISAKETGETYATPQWVIEAGAGGEHVGGGYWEPDYDDPIFLEKIDDFHAALAARYAHEPWLAYVQMASYGSWGEGHNWPASNRTWPFSTLKKHIDMYTKNYPGVRICVSDDIYSVGVDAADRDEIRNYVEANTLLFWTDHSILVDYHAQTFPNSVRSPELFEDSWRTRPVQIEMEHYHKVLGFGHWTVPNGETTGAEMLRGAIEMMHPTYLGYHGEADEWLADNPDVTRDLVNRIGYWYFPAIAILPDNASAGISSLMQITWENHGVAPAYNKYYLMLKIENETSTVTQLLSEMDNTFWMPGEGATETYTVDIPALLSTGDYNLGISIISDTLESARRVELGFNESLRDASGYYKIGTIHVTSTGVVPGLESWAQSLPQDSRHKVYNLKGRETEIIFSNKLQEMPGNNGDPSRFWFDGQKNQTQSHGAGIYIIDYK